MKLSLALLDLAHLSDWGYSIAWFKSLSKLSHSAIDGMNILFPGESIELFLQVAYIIYF